MRHVHGGCLSALPEAGDTIVPVSHVAYRDYVVACQYGNAMGAQRVTGTDLNVYLSREETERQILAAYGPRSEQEVP